MLHEKGLHTIDAWDRLQRMGLIILSLLFFDIAATGAGHYIHVGWFSPRIVLVFLALCCGLPLYFKGFKKNISRPLSILLLAFLVYLAMEALRGRLNENQAAVWLSDLAGFAWLGLLPLMQALIQRKDDLKKLVSFALAGACFQAFLCIVFNIVFAGIAPQALPDFVEWIWSIQWGTIIPVEYNAVRIFCRSSLYLIVACVILFGRIVRCDKINPKWITLFLLNFIAVFLTYTRSMYLTLFAGLGIAIVLLCCYHSVRRVLLRALLLAGLFLLIMGAQDLVLRQGSFQYAMARCFHVDLYAMIPYPHTWQQQEPVEMTEITEESNATRKQTEEELRDMIGASPAIGHGLGAVTPSRQGNDEYFYHDMVMRCGVIGLLLYLAPLLLIMRRLWTPFKNRVELEACLYFVGLICFLIATYYNPWMNAAIGISWYTLNMRASELLGGTNHE